jgi:hypothetical protein
LTPPGRYLSKADFSLEDLALKEVMPGDSIINQEGVWVIVGGNPQYRVRKRGMDLLNVPEIRETKEAHPSNYYERRIT